MQNRIKDVEFANGLLLLTETKLQRFDEARAGAHLDISQQIRNTFN